MLNRHGSTQSSTIPALNSLFLYSASLFSLSLYNIKCSLMMRDEPVQSITRPNLVELEPLPTLVVLASGQYGVLLARAHAHGHTFREREREREMLENCFVHLEIATFWTKRSTRWCMTTTSSFGGHTNVYQGMMCIEMIVGLVNKYTTP